MEVFASKFVYDRINLHNSSLNAVLYQRSRGGANSKTTVERVNTEKKPNIIRMGSLTQQEPFCLRPREPLLGQSQSVERPPA